MALYNKAATVERAIRSIVHQTVADWRLIVVDDGSTDDGPARVHGIDDVRIEIIRQENRGPGAARNVGLQKAHTAFVTFLDADDEWYPWFLEETLAALEDPTVDLAVTPYYLWPARSDIREIWRRFGITPGRYTITGAENPVWIDHFRNVPLAWNMAIRTDLARRCGGFYDRDRCVSGEDSTFFFRVVFAATVLVLDRPAARYHLEDSQLGFFSRRAVTCPPFLQDPGLVLDYCRPPLRPLMQRTLDHAAATRVWQFARTGRKQQACEIMARFPGIAAYPELERRARRAMRFSRLLAHWVRFKCAVGRLRCLCTLRSRRTRTQAGVPLMPHEAT